jgi:hypothetical protein
VTDEISSLRDPRFEDEDSVHNYFRQELLNAVRAKIPGAHYDLVYETAQVWWEEQVFTQARIRGEPPSSTLENEVIYRILAIWIYRQRLLGTGARIGADGILNIPAGTSTPDI